jgi:hypothetical protein
MALELPLPRLQRWMHAVVAHPGSVEEAVAAPAAAAELAPEAIGELILPTRALTPAERVGIYHGMYLLRMEEALATDYPALKHFLGDEGFLALVRGYVQAHPSRSYSLNRLGDALPQYVREAPGLKRREFCHDLARLELAVSEVFDAPETPPLTAASVARVAPEAWEQARLRPIDAFRLLALRYPANEYLQSVRDDRHDHPRPRLKANWLAVYRSDYAVYRLALSRPAHDLLADLAAGRPLGQAVAAAVARGGRRAPGEDELQRWFRNWVAAGLFRSVETEAAVESAAP